MNAPFNHDRAQIAALSAYFRRGWETARAERERNLAPVITEWARHASGCRSRAIAAQREGDMAYAADQRDKARFAIRQIRRLRSM
jgi:hypothetical protein